MECHLTKIFSVSVHTLWLGWLVSCCENKKNNWFGQIYLRIVLCSYDGIKSLNKDFLHIKKITGSNWIIQPSRLDEYVHVKNHLIQAFNHSGGLQNHSFDNIFLWRSLATPLTQLGRSCQIFCYWKNLRTVKRLKSYLQDQSSWTCQKDFQDCLLQVSFEIEFKFTTFFWPLDGVTKTTPEHFDFKKGREKLHRGTFT